MRRGSKKNYYVFVGFIIFSLCCLLYPITSSAQNIVPSSITVQSITSQPAQDKTGYHEVITRYSFALDNNSSSFQDATQHLGSCVYMPYGDIGGGNYTINGGVLQFPQIEFLPGTPNIWYDPTNHNLNAIQFRDQQGNLLNPQPLPGEPIPQGVVVPPQVPYTGLINRIVSCVKEILLRIDNAQIQTLRNGLQTTVMGLVTLYFIFFSIRVLLNGVRNIKSDTFLTLFVAAGVLIFTRVGVDEYVNVFITTQEDLMTIVSTAVDNTNAGCVENNSLAASVVDANGNPLVLRYTIWQRMDCIIASFLGMYEANFPEQINPNTNVPIRGTLDRNGRQVVTVFNDLAVEPFKDVVSEHWISFSLVSIVVGLLFSAVGLLLLFFCVLSVTLMTLAFVQAVYVYLQAMTVIIILGIIAPIVIPMLLFQQTKQIFIYWWHQFWAYMLVPGIMMAYLVFMLSILGDTLYGAPLTAAELADSVNDYYDSSNPTTPYQYPRAGTLMDLYHKARQEGKNRYDLAAVYNVESATQAVGREAVGTGRVTSAGNEKSSVFSLNFFFLAVKDPNTGISVALTAAERAWDKSMAKHFLRELFTVTILWLLLFSFMNNVLNFGAILAGVGASVRIGNIHIYNDIASRISRFGGKGA